MYRGGTIDGLEIGAAFDRVRFVPRVMSGCPYPSTSTTVAGIDLLRQEIETVLVLLGRGGITDLDRSAVELES